MCVCVCVCVCVCYLLVDIGSIEKNPYLWAFVLGKDAKSNLKSYPWQKQDYWRNNWKNSSRERWTKPREALDPGLLKEEHKEHLSREVDQAKRASGARMMRYAGLSRQGF